MDIRLLPSGEVVLEDADDFRRFAVLVPEGTVLADSALAGLVRIEGDHAWVPPGTVTGLHPDAGPDWHRQFDGMVAFAAGKGWTDADGHIRAHIEAK